MVTDLIDFQFFQDNFDRHTLRPHFEFLTGRGLDMLSGDRIPDVRNGIDAEGGPQTAFRTAQGHRG